MTTVIWESDNSFVDGNMFVIFSGTAAINPLFSGGGERLFSDDRFVYKQGITLLRITHGSGILVSSGGGVFSGETNFDLIDITPPAASPLIVRWLLTHYLDDFGDSIGTVAIATNVLHAAGPTEFFTSIYPEAGFWTTQSGYPDDAVEDLVGPDFPQSTRVVVALKDEIEDHVRVHIVSGFQTLFSGVATNWSPLLSISGIVTDLEVVRII